MQNTFETGGGYLRKIRRLMGCLAAPAFFGSGLLIYASDDLGTLAFSIGITAICALALYKAIMTRHDGTLLIDEQGIWITQSTDPLALNHKAKTNRTFVAWNDIENVDIGEERPHTKNVAPDHIPIDSEKLSRRSRFMAQLSSDRWSVMIDHKNKRPCHLYASNMNDPWEAGTALGKALWGRNFIHTEEE